MLVAPDFTKVECSFAIRNQKFTCILVYSNVREYLNMPVLRGVSTLADYHCDFPRKHNSCRDQCIWHALIGELYGFIHYNMLSLAVRRLVCNAISQGNMNSIRGVHKMLSIWKPQSQSQWLRHSIKHCVYQLVFSILSLAFCPEITPESRDKTPMTKCHRLKPAQIKKILAQPTYE